MPARTLKLSLQSWQFQRPNTITVGLAGYIVAIAIRAAWLTSPAHALQVLDAGFLVRVASEDLNEVHQRPFSAYPQYTPIGRSLSSP